ncbi:hypothetical protein AMJ49_04360, partial [Parcubacteria bacterium DG_74_2]
MIISACSLFYMLSTYVVEQASHQTIKYAFYLAPLILFTLIKGINENKKNYLLFSVILWSLAVGDMHWVIFGGIIFLSYIIYDAIYTEGSISGIFKKISINSVFVFGIFLLLNAYWIISGMLSGGTSGNVLTGVGGCFGNASMSNMIAMKGSFGLHNAYGELPQFLSFLEGINLNVFLIVLTFLGLLSFVLVHKKYKEHFFFGLLFTLAIFLSAGPHFAPELFNWFIIDAPLHSFYGWAFRTPKFHQFLILALTPLIAISGIKINQFLKAKNKKIGKAFPFIFLIIVVGFSVFPNYPLLTGDFNGRLKTVEIPEDYKKTIDYLEKDSGDYKIVWGPPHMGPASWNSNPIGNLTNEISPKPCRNDFEILYPLLFGYRLRYTPLILRGTTKNISDFLSPLSVKYLIIHNDILWLKEEIDKTLLYLKEQDKLTLKEENGFVSIFEVENSNSHIEILPLNIDIFEGLEKYNSLTYLEQFNANKIGVIYKNQADLYKISTPSQILVTGNDLRFLNIMSLKGIEFKPFDQCEHYNPDELWSKTTINSAAFRQYLDKRNLLTHYQFDYGKGLVFTWGEDSLEIPFDIEENNNYKLFIRYFENWRGEKMTVHLNGKPIQIETREQLNKFIWK